MRNKSIPSHLFRLLFMGVIICLLQSCYSIVISSQTGTAEPNPANFEQGFYNGKKVNVIDTVISFNIIQNGAVINTPCRGGCLFSVEYKATIGGVLLNAITLGKRKMVRVKYVCIKE